MPSLRRLRELKQRVADDLPAEVDALRADVRLLREALGRIEGRLSDADPSWRLTDHEYRVFSQFGEDGILDFLVRRVDVGRRVFVEFGVEDYTEANTRWLLLHHGWSGLVLDGSPQHVDSIRSSRAYWSNQLRADRAFITAENIDDLLRRNDVTGSIGLLSVDIDGNDYWVWKAITAVEPVIVVAEYNHRFGPTRSVTVPYDPTFVRRDAHYSHVYFGASLAALCGLAEERGYDFVGCGSAGVNAFFVQKARRPSELRALSPEEGFVPGQVREATDPEGRYTYLTTEQELALIADLPLVEVPRP